MQIVDPNCVLLVSGGTSPVGAEIAAQAAAGRATVVVHGSSAASCEAALVRLRARVPDGKFLAAPADFLSAGAIPAMIDTVIAQCGRIDAVIDCALSVPPGISGLFHETDPKQFAELTYRAIAIFEMLCHAAMPHLKARGGAIVAISSDAGRFAAPRQALIGAVRSAVYGFVRNLAVEVARDRVRINCVSLTWVEGTPIFARFSARDGRAERARKRAGLGLPIPADIAPLVLMLCGPSSTKITGQVISINGGLQA